MSHLAVVVSDLEASARFYASVLGLPVLGRHADDAGRPRSVWLDLGGGAFLAVERASAAGPRRADAAPGHHCLALAIEVADRARWRAHLAAAGFPVEHETGYTLYLRDPDGALIALSHHPVPAPPAPR